MGKAAYDAKLAAIDALKSEPDAAKRNMALARALADRNNYIVARAAKAAGEISAGSLTPNLAAAFERFLDDPVKTDPQCWAKNAIVKALADIGHDDPGLYIRGLRHRQPEPVWGGQEDTAGPLRAHCAMALVNCRKLPDLDLLEHLVEALADPEKTVRAEAARAVAHTERREAALLLRLRALSGDTEPEPLGAVYAGILALEGPRGIPFVARFLERDSDAAQEAALALGETQHIEALSALRSTLNRRLHPDLRRTVMAAVGLMRLPEAFELLANEAEAGSKEALEALGAMRLTDGQKARLKGISNAR